MVYFDGRTFLSPETDHVYDWEMYPRKQDVCGLLFISYLDPLWLLLKVKYRENYPNIRQ